MAVQKCDYPVLFIGLGGTGKDTILAIKKKFRERLICDPVTGYPRRTAFLVLDADDNACGVNQPITDGEHINLTVPNLKNTLTHEHHHALPSYIKDWINPNISPASIVVGAGGIRQIGRLQLFQHVGDFKAKLISSLKTHAAVDAAAAGINLKIDVVICGGFSGGTGAGTFLDVSYLVKHWLKESFPHYVTHTYGFFTLPDVYLNDSSIDIGDDDGKHQLMKANAYACLKELDFWMNEREPNNKMRFVQRYGNGPDDQIAWTGAPLDLAFLMDDKRKDGTSIINPYRHIIDKIAEMMLFCYADEQSPAGGASFTFDSFMSNVSTTLLDISIGPNHTIPVNYSFASLGVSSTEAVDQLVSNYETKLVLTEALKIPLVNPDGTVATAGATAVGAAALGGTPPKEYFNSIDNRRAVVSKVFGEQLIFNDISTDDDSYYQMIDTEKQNFSANNRYTAVDRTPEEIRDATEALFDPSIIRSVGNAETQGTWAYQAKEVSEVLYQSECRRYQEQAQDAMRNAGIGPQSWLNYINDVLMPRLEWLESTWEGIANTGNQAYLSARDEAVALSENVRNRNVIERAAYMIHSAPTLDAYAALEGQAAQNRRDAVYAASRKASIHQLAVYIAQHRDTLQFMLTSLNAMRQKADEALNDAPADNSLVTVEELNNYFASQAQKDQTLANAQDAVWNRLATESFDFGDWDGARGTHAEQQEQREQLYRLIRTFLEGVTADLGMNNMDWMIRAIEPHDENAQIAYVASTLCTTLDEAAQTMLPEATSVDGVEIPVLAAEKRYLSVPSTATILQQGFRTYGADSMKLSDINDRVLWLKIRVGVSAANVTDVRDLQQAYESRVENMQLSAGIHLVESAPARKVVDPWRAECSWGLLPNVFPRELYPDALQVHMYQREKENWQETIRLFDSAIAAGLVQFDTTGCFLLQFMRDGMHHTVFCKEVDTIANDAKIALEERKNQLLAKRADWMETSAPIHYQNYLETALSMMGISAPAAGASPDEMAQYERDKENGMHRLCAYLVLMHPNYLKRLQDQLANMQYFANSMAELDRKLEAEKTARAQYAQFARMIVTGRIFLNTGTFCLKTDDKDYPLFQLTLSEMGFGGLAADDVRKGIRQYWEACFLLQYEQAKASIPGDIQHRLDFEVNRFSGKLLSFKNAANEAYQSYVEVAAETLARYRNLVGTQTHLSDIDGDPAFGADDTQVIRTTLKIPYEAMISVLLPDVDILQL